MPGSEAQYYAPYPIAVERPVYRYVINYYADAADGSTQLGEGNYLGSYEGEASSPTLATLPEELLNRYLPAQGYEPLTAGDFSPYTLNEQGTTTIELVYSPSARRARPGADGAVRGVLLHRRPRWLDQPGRLHAVRHP